MLATSTPVFDVLVYAFYLLSWLLQIGDPLLVAKASALGIAEMFLPTLLVIESSAAVKFVLAVVSVPQVILFSAMGALRHGHRHPHLDPEDAGDLGRPGDPDAVVRDPGGFFAARCH